MKLCYINRIVRFKCLGGLLLCATLAGCNQAALIAKRTSPEAETAARSYVDLLRQGKFDQIEPDLDPSLVNSNLPDTLARMAALLAQGSPRSVKIVGVQRTRNEGAFTTSITFEYQLATKWFLVAVATRDDTSKIVGFDVKAISDSLENLNRFTLVGKSPMQYTILTLAVCSLTFSFSMLVLCIRTKGIRRKWLWMLFILVGVEKVAVNWNTGQLTFGILSVYIPPATATHALYGPWTVGVCLPLGAILFLIQRRRLSTTSDLAPPLNVKN